MSSLCIEFNDIKPHIVCDNQVCFPHIYFTKHHHEQQICPTIYIYIYFKHVLVMRPYYVEVSNLKLCICKSGQIVKFCTFRDSQMNWFGSGITEFYHPEATEERLQLLQRECKMLAISGYSEYIFPIYGCPYSTKEGLNINQE